MPSALLTLSLFKTLLDFFPSEPIVDSQFAIDEELIQSYFDDLGWYIN